MARVSFCQVFSSGFSAIQFLIASNYESAE
jgi:hypothetical protein